MSTSNRTMFFEATFASALVLLLVTLASPRDFGVPALGVHPAWLPITLFAARYGARGLLISIVLVATPLLIAGLWLTQSHTVLLARAHNPSDVLALFTAVAATWVGMGHNNRVRRVLRRHELSRERQERAEGTVGELSRTLEILRARCDRMDTSLTLWRSLAERFERGTPAEAAGAALELCALRCGAGAGVVQVRRSDGSNEIIAHRGTWRMGQPQPKELAADATVRAATHRQQAVCATEVAGSADTDSDIVVPILTERDRTLLGVLALRGIDPIAFRSAEKRDLRLIADWLTPQLARLSVSARLRAVPDERC